MLYFIPAWYQENKWCENEQRWSTRRMHTEFDDTVKHIQLFHRQGGYPYQILLLSFAPNFRHFLHRQGVLHAFYWSCFDAIQEVRRKQARVLSFHDLKWPSPIEFVYDPFAVIAFYHGKKYAQIDFGEDGNPIRIDLYDKDVVCRRNIYDDRGFVSSTIVYKNGEPLYQDYLMENGMWKLRCFQIDGHVEINPKYPEFSPGGQKQEYPMKFSRLQYDSLEEVIYEVLTAYLRSTDKKDIFCIAMHKQHMRVLKEVLAGRKVILSVFEDRYSLEKCDGDLELIRKADYVIADSQDNMRKMTKQAAGSVKNITVIPPYDSRIDFGISQQLNVEKVLVPVDGMGEQVFRRLVCLLAEYISGKETVAIHLFTRKADYGRDRQMMEQVRRILHAAGFEEGWATEAIEDSASDNNIDLTETISPRFYAEQCVDELAVSKCIREQRLIVDLREKTDLYLQTLAISFGIPQIVCTGSEYVRNKKNGIILERIEDLYDALDYYLDELRNWNEARIYAYEFVREHTADKLLHAWKGVVDAIG